MKPNALTITNLHKTYGNSVEALKNINLEVCEGDFFALLGPNGAGKSTLISILTSLVNKTSGKVNIFGYDIDEQLDKAKICLGVVPQEFNMHSFEKVEDIIIQQAGYYGIGYTQAKDRCHKYLRLLELFEKRKTQVRFLSGGMKRRLMIARALVHEPRLLILDEPTAGVDIEIRRSMWHFLRKLNKQGTTIILTTHYLEEAEQLCKNVAIINEGTVLTNTTMRELLLTINTQSYVLDVAEPIDKIPQQKNITFSIIDTNTIEATIANGESINTIFQALSNSAIKVLSMRTKGNRLEELFLHITK